MRRFQMPSSDGDNFIWVRIFRLGDESVDPVGNLLDIEDCTQYFHRINSRLYLIHGK
jgi:hypothetical protein